MVNTVKFSEFDPITLNGTNSLVGLSDGNNAISELPINWTTAERPVSPTDGFSGYNTSIFRWEFWNGNTLSWEPIGGGGTGTVTQIDTGDGLTGGPITTSGVISFEDIPANTFLANTTGGADVPVATPLSDFLLASNNLSDVPNKPLARTNLGVAIGVNVEAWSAILDQVAGGVWPGSTSITTLGTITTGVWAASTIPVNRGGTGNTSFTAYSVICAGTAATLPFQNVVGVGILGQALVSNGPGALPSWQSIIGSGTVNAGLINQVAYYPANGTAVSGLTGANSGVLVSTAAGAPIWTSSMTDGSLVMGVTGGTPVVGMLLAGAGVSIVNGPGTITISASGAGPAGFTRIMMLMGA